MAGRPKGALNKDKPFADALRIELAAAGEDHRALRAIARNLIELAQEPSKDALSAINAIADRLDGKPAQTTDVNVRNVTARELNDDELAAIALGGGEGVDPAPVDPGQLN